MSMDVTTYLKLHDHALKKARRKYPNDPNAQKACYQKEMGYTGYERLNRKSKKADVAMAYLQRQMTQTSEQKLFMYESFLRRVARWFRILFP